MVAIAALAIAGLNLPASADALGGAGFTPRVPISALARPASWFDASRLHVTTSLTVGSGYGSGFGSGTNALQVTSLSYQFQAPLWMNVSLGNTWGGSASSQSSFFLEGLDLAYRPIPSMVFHVQYRDYRSPLQYSRYGPRPDFGTWGR